MYQSVIRFVFVLFAVSCGMAATIAPEFASNYSLTILGNPEGVAGPLGGLTFHQGNPNSLLIGGGANAPGGTIYQIGLTRDLDGHVTGFSGNATEHASAPNIDGGLSYGPGGVLFYAAYPLNSIGQILPGETSAAVVTDITSLGVTSSVGALQYIPSGFPQAGKLAIASYTTGLYCISSLTANGSGTYNLSACEHSVTIPGNPEGIVFVPAGSALFDTASILVSEYGAGSVSAYELDANGLPIVDSRRTFISGLTGAEGAVIDPVTGDFFFSTFGGGNQVIRVSGFSIPEAEIPEPATGILSFLALVGLCMMRKKRA